MDIKTWHTLLLEHGRKDGTPLATRTVHLPIGCSVELWLMLFGGL